MDAGAGMGRSKPAEDHPGATWEVRSPERSQQETGGGRARDQRFVTKPPAQPQPLVGPEGPGCPAAPAVQREAASGRDVRQ